MSLAFLWKVLLMVLLSDQRMECRLDYMSGPRMECRLDYMSGPRMEHRLLKEGMKDRLLAFL